jgi:predicted MPP superfamily phosphohydrolase
LIQILLSLLALLGHFALGLGAFSRMHAWGLRRSVVQWLDKLLLVLFAGIPALFVFYGGQRLLLEPVEVLQAHRLLHIYFWVCFGVALFTALVWCWRTWVGDTAQLLAQDREVVHVTRALGHRPCGDTATRALSLIPGNQILQLEIAQKTVLTPRLPRALDGLSIVHLSDLHFCGRTTAEYFELVVARANALQPDLVAITGDVLDDRRYVPWLTQILGRLQPRWGTFCVWGNHDLRVGDKQLLIQNAERAGLQYVGGRWCAVTIRGQTIAVGGNELPWFRPAADPDAGPRATGEQHVFRILLSHSPDQIGWARRADCDLMLAGHTHGGQIRLPVIGPLVGESRYGVKYCGSLYYERPTLLHVSRGISALQPLRINCRPELTKLVLRCEPVERATRANFVLPTDYLPRPETAVGRCSLQDLADETPGTAGG